jgi:hypothetical protein
MPTMIKDDRVAKFASLESRCIVNCTTGYMHRGERIAFWVVTDVSPSSRLSNQVHRFHVAFTILRPGLAILVQSRMRSEILYRAVSYNVQETGDVNK